MQNLNALCVGGLSYSRKQRSAAFVQSGPLNSSHEFALKNILASVARFETVEPCGSRGLNSLLDSLDVGEVYGVKKYPAEDIIFALHKLPEKCSIVDASSLLYDSVPWIDQPELVLKQDF